MSITSTGIYGVNSTIVTSDLYEDVDQLKTNLTTLTTSHLSVATNHDGRLDTLESDNTSNITRIGDLEIDVSSNITRISDLEIDVSSNITRIGDLETDVSSNKARLTDTEDQIFDVVHEPNKHEQEFFYYTPYPVPYDVLEAYSQLIHDKSLTLKDRFDLSANHDINSVVKVVQEILQDHEMNSSIPYLNLKRRLNIYGLVLKYC